MLALALALGLPLSPGKGGNPWTSIGNALRVGGMTLRVASKPLVVGKVS